MKDKILFQVEMILEDVEKWNKEIQQAMEGIAAHVDSPRDMVTFTPPRIAQIKESLLKIHCAEGQIRTLRELARECGGGESE